ncbi:hypothetical protein C5E07_10445 [Pseudoclavibacter sp. RFBJ3]|uniref:hypothetical protein n=1 Tax=unclassified Pseudoclavibacter TaxID=2615177 RepID=UPI000CE926BC|nr:MULTISPECIES: hypothetical protein [unclassified Pseudoclavibacter]PPF83894.1 hypothetical protein C5C12_09525 [Pseudoclavibacter sp. RFBJ5]PPF92174.1 hypothetical protein C5E07_10445 [Pseudoclavibacter sp. RFBJ3]PPF97037.1 hypothetical protein C5C19_13755 [Pseudoclavibacter sp. RFBH5]PPG23724.1 hypothetical protein C5E13_09140 [Pseudoclavibacter sp. RFBI4]
MQNSSQKTGDRLIGRRNVVQGAAWAAPVVAFAVTAPQAVASPCDPIDATLTATWAQLQPEVPFFTETLSGAPWGTRTNDSQTYGSVYTSVNFSNTGVDAVPAGGLVVFVGLTSNPGTRNADATPFSGFESSPFVSDDWEYMDTTISDGPSEMGGYLSRFDVKQYRYKKPLAPGATTSGIQTWAIPSSPRPKREDYGSNWTDSPPAIGANYGQVFGAGGSYFTCRDGSSSPVNVSSEEVLSDKWGVFYPNA